VQRVSVLCGTKSGPGLFVLCLMVEMGVVL
jgi:hypothetical protein